jgi:hypothetical protein
MLLQGIHHQELLQSLKNVSLSATSWLKANTRFQSIMGSILAVTHPGQYKAGIEMLKILKDNSGLPRESKEITKVVDSWCTPFSGVSVICNRETPLHKYIYGRHDWYHILATMGTHPPANFGLPGLQITFSYSPRTVVALCGQISHTAGSSDHGDRACFAWYMREDVREYLDVVPGAAATLTELIS